MLAGRLGASEIRNDSLFQEQAIFKELSLSLYIYIYIYNDNNDNNDNNSTTTTTNNNDNNNDDKDDDDNNNNNDNHKIIKQWYLSETYGFQETETRALIINLIIIY